MRWLLRLLLTFCLIVPSQSSANYEQSLSFCETICKIKANVIVLRHAVAPGMGDPTNFELNYCSTQRNLDRVGRRQTK